LRLTESQFGLGGGDLDLFNASSVRFTPLGIDDDYVIQSDSRSLVNNLESIDDTGFYLGHQSSLSLLDRILSN